MARRGTKHEHYEAIAAFYGSKVAEDVSNPRVPGFAIYQAARIAGHFALEASRLRANPRRKSELVPGVPMACEVVGPILDSTPA